MSEYQKELLRLEIKSALLSTAQTLMLNQTAFLQQKISYDQMKSDMEKELDSVSKVIVSALDIKKN